MSYNILTMLCSHRSIEGRRRIINEIVHELSLGTPSSDTSIELLDSSTRSAFSWLPGCPHPTRLAAMVQLVGHLLSCSHGAGSTLPAATSHAVSADVVRCMREAGMIKALTNILRLVDLDHPQVSSNSSKLHCCISA